MSFADASNHRSGPNDPLPFELTQYTPEGVERLISPYKKDPRLLEKVSKRITARVEEDSSDLITFCDKRIRKRRKKKKLEEQERRRQHLRPLSYDYPVAPEVVMASDLCLGACLGQGSFSSVFVLEKHVQKSTAGGPRRGRRSRLARPRLDGTNQGSSHNMSWSNHSAMFSGTDNNNSISKRSTRTRSQTPSLRDRFQQSGSNANDASNRSGTGNSQRSRSLSPPRSKNTSPKDLSSKSYHEHSETAETETSSPIKVLRSPSKDGRSERRRSSSLSASIQKGIRAVFQRNSGTISNSNTLSNHQSIYCDDDELEIPLSCSKTFTQKSKSHHVRSECEEDDSKNGRGILGGSRSLSLHRRRKSRRSRSRDKSGGRRRGFSLGDFEDSSSHKAGPQFNLETNSSNESNLVVKILQPKLMNQPKLFANCAAGLIREGLFLAAIDHPNVLKVHAWTSPNGWMEFADLARKDGDLYDGYILVLERLQGGSLKGWLRKWHRDHEEEQKQKLSLTASTTGSSSNSLKNLSPGSPKSISDTLPSYFSDRSYPYTHAWPTTQLADRTSLLLQLSDTVRYLHKHRILHRDLKPDNLGVTFIDPRSDYLKQKQYPSSLSLKVFDFDVARLVPEEPKKESPKKSKRRGSASAGSIASFDAEALFTSRSSGRSVSPHRTSSSLGGEDPANRKRGKRYRGKRSDSTKTEVSIPTSIYGNFGEVEEPPIGDALFNLTAKMGSPRYMAPEIARGEPYNLRSEVYTVCLLVHEVLTLQKPYDELAPEDHGKLVHFDLPGYRPPVFSEWSWPAELEEVLHLGWGEIHFRPSMKDLHSVLKKTLPKLCPALLQLRSSARGLNHSEHSPRTVSNKSSSTKPTSNSEHKSKARSLFHRSHHKRGSSKTKRGTRSSSLTPTASNSDFFLSNDEPRIAAAQ